MALYMPLCGAFVQLYADTGRTRKSGGFAASKRINCMTAAVETNIPAKATPTRHRWWPAAAILLLVTAGVVYFQFFNELNRGYQFWGAVGVGFLGLLAEIVWLGRFLGLKRLARLGLLFFPFLLLFGIFSFVEVDEWDGDSIPLNFQQRPWIARLIGWQGNQPGPIAEIQSRSATIAAGEHDFPQFLGPDRDGMVRGVKLARDWKARPPRELWRRNVGEGWSSFAVVGDYAFTQELRGTTEVVACYHLHTGEPLWLHEHEDGYTSPGPDCDGPRATPTVIEGRVYAVSGKGHVHCLEAASGQQIWSRDLLADVGANNTMWGKACSPLVYGRFVVVTGGGKTGPSLIALDRRTGKTVWTAAWSDEEQGTIGDSYASPMLAALHNVPQILNLEDPGLAAYHPETGEQLWRHDWPQGWRGHPKVSQPLVLPDERIFISASYNAGCTLLQVARDELGKFSTKEVWKSGVLKTKFSNAVRRGDHLYGLHERFLRCIEFATGKEVWRAKVRYGHGQILLVDDLILVQCERPGDIVLVEASPGEHRELGRVSALSRTTWNTMALSGKHLLLRNDQEAVCFELPLE
jgi:outer membrane protein assembly factor BamB